MEHSTSFLLVKVALKLSEFDELSGSTGEYTYFRHRDGRIVQISRTQELADSQLREIADQSKIHTEVFMDRIATIRIYLDKINHEKNHKK